MKIRTLVLSSSLLSALLSPASAQVPVPNGEEEITCNRTLLDRSDLFKEWLALWNEQLGELKLSDFVEVHAKSSAAFECTRKMAICGPLDAFQRAKPHPGPGDTTTLVFHSPDRTRSISLTLCEGDCSPVVNYYDSVRNEGWEIGLSISPDIAGWLSTECFFVAGFDRGREFGKPAVWLYGRSPAIDSEIALVAESVPASSVDQLAAFDERMQPWLETRFPMFRCYHKEYRELEHHVFSAVFHKHGPLSMDMVDTIFNLVLRDGKIDVAESSLLRWFFENVEDEELSPRLRKRIEGFRLAHLQ